MGLIEERLEQGVCPICGRVLDKLKVIQDAKYGEVKICERHEVKNV